MLVLFSLLIALQSIYHHSHISCRLSKVIHSPYLPMYWMLSTICSEFLKSDNRLYSHYSTSKKFLQWNRKSGVNGMHYWLRAININQQKALKGVIFGPLSTSVRNTMYSFFSVESSFLCPCPFTGTSAVTTMPSEVWSTLAVFRSLRPLSRFPFRCQTFSLASLCSQVWLDR